MRLTSNITHGMGLKSSWSKSVIVVDEEEVQL